MKPAPKDSDIEQLTLTEFLLARIAEDEAVARATIDELAFLGPPRTRGRAIADCEAKKRIVERFARHSQSGTSRECRRCDTLRDLASVYADHPDYRAEWKP
jgi:hypothetical protein